jgi:rSAM/selenodomain-associated transferase 1
MPNALVVMAKRPRPGQTKTRLCPPLTPEAACDLYKGFLHDTLDLMRGTPDVVRIIAYLPEDEHAYFSTLAPDFELIRQRGDSLGERLDAITTQCLTNGFDQVVVMDSDSPTLPPHIATHAFESLKTTDVVLGPCEDGGYYLIGLKQPAPHLLRDMPMSTPTVLIDTIRLAKRANLAVSLLPTWYDIDTAAELAQLRTELQTLSPERATHTRQVLVNTK